ncbi:MAG: GAF domain-containing protein, partial [Terracidiphilus sp.]
MESNLLNRAQATLLALATAALVMLAFFNLRQERQFPVPDDGVWWHEVAGGLTADRVLTHMPGQLAGIQAHDLLTAVDGAPVESVAELEQQLYRTGPYLPAYYTVTRDGYRLDTPIKVIPVPMNRNRYQAERIISLIYLAIGIYVLFRRWGAPRSTHFYLFCLVSFALFSLHYTGQFDALDWTAFWANVLAEALQPALFLHFALSFPEERFARSSRRWLLPVIYAPGAALMGLWVWAIGSRSATKLLLDRLNQTATGYVAAFYLLTALLFLVSYRRADSPLLRQQLKWVTRGTLLAVAPFTLLYAVPYLLQMHPPELLTDAAYLSLVFLPLTFIWAIVRYRLMDTDLIFKRGVAYTLATGLLLGGYFGVIAIVAVLVHNGVHSGMPQAVREWGLVISVVVAAAVFEPLKRRIQNWVDRAFDRHRYDYRQALVEFGHGLSSETDLQALLKSIVDRLPRTLQVARVAVILADHEGRLRLAASHGLPVEAAAEQAKTAQDGLALGFLDFDGAGKQHSHLFLENAQHTPHLPLDQQRTAALLDLNYYLPCRVARPHALRDHAPNGASPGKLSSRTIAVIGLGRTLGGDFLSSEDVELLSSLASYIGIALQNASLYARLEEKIGEFERLK